MDPWRSTGPDWPGLREAQWLGLRRLLPKPRPPHRKAQRRGGRPRADDRRCLEGILWILRTGAPWRALPQRFGNRRTTLRRLALWDRQDRLRRLWRAYLSHLGRSDLEAWAAAMGRTNLGYQPLWQADLEFIYRMEFRRGRP